ncbi:MAG: hypothetical protein D6682_03260 [Zetaproteobacteria bacterium]|nr:MAG: hypothetical protein D6682_03260 [Zetaproteobacteria bacterium]
MATLSELKADARKALLARDHEGALQLFREIHEQAPDDMRAWCKMAELMEKCGDVDGAVREYNAIAGRYANEGFVVQAIAISKIVLRLDPENRRASERLRELSRERGEEWSGDTDARRATVAFKETPLISGLSGEELQAFIGYLHPRMADDGEAIVRAGEAGDFLFLIGSGSVRLETVDAAGARKVVRRLEAGDFFGEHAFMARTAYQDDAIAEGHTVVLEIDRATFDQWCERHPSIQETVERFYRQRVLERVLATSDLFRGIPAEACTALTEHFRRRTFHDGACVVRQGEKGDSCFLIRSGVVSVTTEDFRRPGRVIDLGELREGAFFGEVALLNDKPRTATVTARGEVELMELTREDFRAIIDRFPQVLQTVEAYQRERVRSTIRKVTAS